MTEPLVTVLTTTYNHARFIGLCMRSVQRQSYRDFEHVIVDDGSTDGTGDVVERLADKRTVYIRKEHSGFKRLVDTYNCGLKVARGKFIAIVEGDDFIPSWRLHRQVPFMRKDVVLSFGRVATVDNKHRLLGVDPPVNAFDGWVWWTYPLVIRDYITALSVMVDAEALRGIGGFVAPSDGGAVDYATFLELSLVGDFVFVSEVLGYWVRHGGNYSDAYVKAKFNSYAVQFCRKHGLPVPYSELRKQYGRDVFHVGRHLLLSKRYREASERFRVAFNLGDFGCKARSLAGLCCSSLGFDLEGLTKLLGRTREYV